MDRSTYTEEVQKRHEALLLDVGNKLANPPSSTDELLPLLSRAEILLHRVFQKPHESIQAAIRPAMNALISEKILKHTDLNIQVAVASCFNEIIRIASPDYPYTDDQMKEVFGLFMVAFKQLSCESGKNYYRALEILDTVSTIRSCVIMQDIEIDSMVVEMFEIFFNTIKTNNSADVFMHMKAIMTMMVEECECDEFTEDLVRPLLSSVKLDNKNASLRSWDLGRSVIENCATKLQRYVREVVKAMNLNVADYAEIVASLCKDTPTGNDTVATKEVELVVSTQVANEAAGEVESVRVGNEEVATTKFEATDASGDGISNLVRAMPEIQMQVGRSRRGLRPNTFTRADEGYQHTWLTGGLGSSRGYYYLLSPSEHKNAQDSSQKKNDSVQKLNIGKRGQSKKKESMTSQDKAEEVSPETTNEILPHDTVGSVKQKKMTIGLHVGSGTVGTEKEQVHCSASDSDGKDKNKITSQGPESGDVVDKVVEPLMSGSAKTKHSKGKEKCSNIRKKTAKRVVVGSVEIGSKKELLNHNASGSQLEDKSGSTSQQHESAYVEKMVKDPISEPTTAKKCKVEEKGLIKGKKTTEGGVVRSRRDASKKAKVSHSAADPEAKDENEHDSHKLDSVDMDKVVESTMSQPAKAKQSEVKEKGSEKGKKRSRSFVEFGVDKGNVSHSAADAVLKDENATTPVVRESSDVEKVVESPTSMPTKAKQSKLRKKIKKISKSVVVQSDTLGAEKEKLSHGAIDRERKKGNKITSQNHQKYEPADVGDKVVESVTTAKAKLPGSSDAEKEMEPTDVRLEYGQELVNLRIMVWWPIDKTYYTGTVVAFDHATKKHKILYDDDEEETLDMSEENWELFNDI